MSTYATPWKQIESTFGHCQTVVYEHLRLQRFNAELVGLNVSSEAIKLPRNSKNLHGGAGTLSKIFIVKV